ncbi:hypothetical protein BKA56DRAFT_609884 [Ilyonectria sp. MPI-CAGE-AT-0026]|nr:hypothetical protein BKA56DRAFT_609884 [Ilyonectria sp. MPI-CAGE-AT-0026]
MGSLRCFHRNGCLCWRRLGASVFDAQQRGASCREVADYSEAGDSPVVARGRIGGAAGAPERRTTRGMRAGARGSVRSTSMRLGSGGKGRGRRWQVSKAKAKSSFGARDHSAFRSRHSRTGNPDQSPATEAVLGRAKRVGEAGMVAGEELGGNLDLRCLVLSRDVSVSQPD